MTADSSSTEAKSSGAAATSKASGQCQISHWNTITTPLTRDADGLITGYGPFTFTRSGPAGAVSRISDPALSIAVTYDSLGRVAGRTHTVNGQTVYRGILSEVIIYHPF